MAFLDDCARSTGGSATQIDYPTLVNATRGDLYLLQQKCAKNISDLLRRQAALQALDDEGRGADVQQYSAAGPTHDPGYLASIGLAIRSSHSGTPIDRLLPQGPYNAIPVPPPVGIRDAANYAWLRESSEEHTWEPGPASGLAHDRTRVASYFELHIPPIRDRGQLKLNDGRVVYDPFNHRLFVSRHYEVEFELINVPAVTAHLDYQPTRNRIQIFAQNQVAGAPPWSDLYDQMYLEMGDTRL